MKNISTKNEIQGTTNVKLGIAYILWILVAWTIVGLYKFTFYSKIAYQSEVLNTIFKEAIRFLVFMGPILVFITRNAKEQWCRWIGLYGCKKGTLYNTIPIAVMYAAIGITINKYGLHKTANASSISLTFLLTTFSLSIIMEEIAFRGFLFYLFEKWNKNTVVVITSLAFAAKHLPGWLFFPSELSSLGIMGDFSIVFIIGCILGYLYLSTHSIWATLIIHSINNLIVALFS